MTYKTKYSSMYAYSRSDSYAWSVDYCLEKNYTQMMEMTSRSITRHYAIFLSYIEEGVEDIQYHKNSRVGEILDAKYHLHLHELVAEL